MPEPAGKSLFSVMSLSNAKLDLLLKLYVTVITVKKTLFAKDYLLTLLKSRLAIGRLFVGHHSPCRKWPNIQENGF